MLLWFYYYLSCFVNRLYEFLPFIRKSVCPTADRLQMCELLGVGVVVVVVVVGGGVLSCSVLSCLSFTEVDHWKITPAYDC